MLGSAATTLAPSSTESFLRRQGRSQQSPTGTLGSTAVLPDGAEDQAGRVLPGQDLTGLQRLMAFNARRSGLDPALALAVAQQESGFRMVPGDGGRSRGYYQVGAQAAQDVGVDPARLDEPWTNIQAGQAYLKQLLDANGGDVAKALQQYNSGKPDGSPAYATSVLARLPQYRTALGAAAPAEGQRDAARRSDGTSPGGLGADPSTTLMHLKALRNAAEQDARRRGITDPTTVEAILGGFDRQIKRLSQSQLDESKEE